MRLKQWSFVGLFISCALFAGSLTVSAAPVSVFSDGFETGNFSAWDYVDAPKWVVTNSSAHSGSKSALVTGNTGNSTDDLGQEISTVGYASVTISYWYKASNLHKNDAVELNYTTNGQWNGGNSHLLFSINDDNDDNQWHKKTHVLPASALNKSLFEFNFAADIESSNSKVWIDDFEFSVTYTEDTSVRCADGIDNDDDGKTDLLDSGCAAYLPATIIATKIVCDNESDLPNYGKGGPNMTSSTAANWVASHPNCHLASGWQFQWSPQSGTNPGDTLVGTAPSPWTTSLSTLANGATTWTVPLSNVSVIRVREVLQGGYIPFTHQTYPDNSKAVSAEIYCGTDVLNYDNFDFITSPQAGQTYYCVAWNAPIDLCANISGTQASIPEGMEAQGDVCTLIPPPVVDVCANIPEVQETVLEGMVDTEGICTQIPVPPTDVCSNLEGVQETVPSGMSAADGVCVQIVPETDLCTNIPEAQSTIPEGMEAVDGICTTIVVPPTETDVCPNISEVQTTVPQGMEIVDGQCVPAQGGEEESTDLCTNIEEDQTVVPEGMTAIDGVCTTIPDDGGDDETPTDLCTNIEGDQTTLPSGMTTSEGICTEQTVTPPSGGGGGAVPQQCADGDDNDNDGFRDLLDPDCVDSLDNSESGSSGPAITPLVSTDGPGNGLGTTTGEVLGASTTEPALPPQCSEHITSYLGMGKKNDVEEVKKLQQFLNETLGTTIPVSGFFGQMTKTAVKKFQKQYHAEILQPWIDAGFSGGDLKEGTGYVFKTTKRWINMMKCTSLETPIPDLRS